MSPERLQVAARELAELAELLADVADRAQEASQRVAALAAYLTPAPEPEHQRPEPGPVVDCAHSWALEDPNPEDLANGATHDCQRPEGHPPPHRCRCGAVNHGGP